MRTFTQLVLTLCAVAILACCAMLVACAQQTDSQTGSQPARVAAGDKEQSSGGKKRLAVVNFDTPEEYWGTPLSKGLADMMITSLVKSGSFDVIERTQLDALLKERNLSAQGLIDPATAAQTGKILGVDYILGGKVTEFGIKTKKSGLGALLGRILGGVDIKNSTARVKMDVRLVDVNTARILIADTGLAEEKEGGIVLAGGDISSLIAIGRFDTKEWEESRIGKATRKAVDQVVGKITAFFPPCGKVLAVLEAGTKRYAILDLGRFSGLEIGREFKVCRETAIKDDTGVVVWNEKTDIGTVRVVEVQNERSKAEIISEKTPIQKGDVFMIPPSPKPEPEKKK